MDRLKRRRQSFRAPNGKKLPRHTPAGTGEHTVGIVDVMSNTGDNGCFVRLYYPATKADIYAREKQWPRWLPRKQYGAGYVYFMDRNTKIFGKIFNWIGGDIYVPGLWKHSVLQNDSKFPVVIFSHGIGGNRTTYTTLCCELASQGFLVAALEHRDGSSSFTYCLHDNINNNVSIDHPTTQSIHRSSSFTEEFKWFEKIERWDDFTHRNRQMYIRADEVIHALDILQSINDGGDVHNILHHDFDLLQFKNRLDMDKASIIGHSFGGSTCVCALAKEKRFKVGIALDSWMHPIDDEVYNHPTQPILFINSETFQWEKNVQQMKQLIKEDSQIERKMITILGTCHQSQTDFQFLINKAFGRILNVRHTLSPAVAMDLNNKAVLGFLQKHLDPAHPSKYEYILEGKHELVISGARIVRKDVPSSD